MASQPNFSNRYLPIAGRSKPGAGYRDWFTGDLHGVEIGMIEAKVRELEDRILAKTELISFREDVA